MNTLAKSMRTLQTPRQKLVYLYLYYNSMCRRIHENASPEVKYSYSIDTISYDLNMHRSNLWHLIKDLESYEMIDIVQLGKKIEVFV